MMKKKICLGDCEKSTCFSGVRVFYQYCLPEKTAIFRFVVFVFYIFSIWCFKNEQQAFIPLIIM